MTSSLCKKQFPFKQARSDLMGENLLGMEINNADR